MVYQIRHCVAKPTGAQALEVFLSEILRDFSYYTLNNLSASKILYERLSCFRVPFSTEVAFRFLCAAYMARESVKYIAELVAFSEDGQIFDLLNLRWRCFASDGASSRGHD